MAKPQENYDCPTSALPSGCRSVRPDLLKKVPYYNTQTVSGCQPVMCQLFNTNSLHFNFIRLYPTNL